MTLEVLICTCGPAALDKVLAMDLPELPSVSYLVAWQDSRDTPVPPALAQRRDIRIIPSPGLGLSRNRNLAFAHASADILLIADDDLRYHPGALHSILNVFEADPSLDFATFRYDSPDAKYYPSHECSLSPLPKNYYPTSCEIALRRSTLERHGLRMSPLLGIGAPYLGSGEEDLLLLQCQRLGLGCRFFPITICTHEGHTTGSRRATPSTLRAVGAIIMLQHPLSAPLRLPLAAWRRYRSRQASFFPALAHLAAGMAYALRNRDILLSPSHSPQPPLSVVIPVFNRQHIVETTLRSVAAQTLRPLALVLVDNGSSDGSLDLLQRWAAENRTPDLSISVVSEPSPGASAARNRGLHLVTTPYTLFFDSDDIMAPTHCQRVLQAFLRRPQTDIVGFPFALNTPTSRRIIPFFSRRPLWHCIQHGSMATLHYAARTDLFRNAGAWREDCRQWDDIELGARLLSLNPKIIHFKGAPTVEVMANDISITGTDFASRATFFEHALDCIDLTVTSSPASPCRRRRHRWVALRRVHLAGLYAAEGASKQGRSLLRAVLSDEKCPFYRSLFRLGFLYTRLGGRGMARLLHWLF